MMRLRKLDLALFGHFTNQSIDFGDRPVGGSDFHIVYGPNETGKTTLMEGYLRLLYGFPGKDAYAFKHQRANLRVGGTIEINDTAHKVTRVSTRSPNLVDAAGKVVSETLIQSALGGLAMEDYRKLLCLDDQTIEAGGDEITKSKGDIGKLLFSAAAGISDLSQVLEDVEGHTVELYLKGGSKSVFAALKRDHDAVGEAIKNNDVNASAYRMLREVSDRTRATETKLREEKKALTLRKVRLASVINARPMAAMLEKAEEELKSIEHYPQILGIDPETLVTMMTERAALIAKGDGAVKNLDTVGEQKKALVRRPEILKIAPQFEALGVLKSRVETAQFDLPKRETQLITEEEELCRRLSELGIAAHGDLTRFVLSDTQLATLEQRRTELRDAEKDLESAEKELRGNDRKFDDATKALETAQREMTIGPELSALFVRYSADATLESYKAASLELALSKRQVAAKLHGLTCMGVAFESLPVVGITSAGSKELTSRIAKADSYLEASEALVTAAAQKWGRAQTALKAGAALPELISDIAVHEIRGHRDALWTVHRSALSEDTASQFETAMQADDVQRSIREGQTKEIAEHRLAVRAEAETRNEFDMAKQAHDAAKEIALALCGRLAVYLENSGLPVNLSADEFARWVSQTEEARQAIASHEALSAEHAALFETAKALERALVKELGEPEASLDALVAMAQELVTQRADQQRNVLEARAGLARESTELERRRQTIEDCKTSVLEAQAAWASAVAKSLPDAGSDVDLVEALPTLRALREINERLNGVRRQIDGMRLDLTTFEGEIWKLAPTFGIVSDIGLLDTYAQIDAQLSEARRVERVIAGANDRIASEEKERDDANAQIEIIDAQVREMASVFDPRIQTATLVNLRDAVKEAARAITLRATVRSTLQNLLTTLTVKTREEAQAELNVMSAEQAEADLEEALADSARAELQLDKAIEDRTKAKVALDAVVGDSDVAELVSRKRTIEADMEAVLLQYLEGRLGHTLADRAIRRYRDTHRSGMMAATEKAFSDLTNGAYCALTAEPRAGGEVLMAIQTSDKVSKEASAMSKGTRFQLYMALRAAAYEQIASNGTILPFFCDDVFETFDDQRTRAACQLMNRIGETGQAIYLTHHQHVVDIAREVCGDRVRLHAL
jgi:uncharacterized protein YhaN